MNDVNRRKEKEMPRKDRPNILVFLMDTQPVRNIGCYGYSKNTTPNIDKIAEEGAVYENHFGTGSWTVPSHASLFTGEYQSGHGVGVQFEFMPDDYPTMPEILERAGYQTVAFSNNSWVNQDETNIARGWRDFTLVKRPKRQNVQVGPEDDFILDTNEDSGSLSTVKLVEEWLEKKWDRDKPFAMFINCIEPHLRVWAPQPFRDQFLTDGVTDEKAREVNQDVFAERMGFVNRPGGHMTPEDWEILKMLYDGETACLDNRIGLLYNYLKQNGILDKTFLIITSDHGDLLDRVGMMGHHLSLFDDLIHIPLIMRYPSVVPKNKCIKHLVQNCDLLPTLIDFLGIDDDIAKEEIQGVSLVPTWDDHPVREFIIAEYMKPLQTIERALRRNVNFDYRPWLRRIKVLRTLDYKYHWYSDGQDMLFDINKEPGERNNIIDKNPEQALKMKAILEKFLISLKKRDYGDKMRNSRFRNVRWDNVDKLKAWGIYREITQVDK